MDTFWTTWVEGTSGGYGRPQPSFEEARLEAERLAQMPKNVGKPVRILQCLGTMVAKSVVWEPCESENWWLKEDCRKCKMATRRRILERQAAAFLSED